MYPSQIDYDATLLECHIDLDLEGFEEVDSEGEMTGIKIPYIVTLSYDTGEILAIRRNYAEGDELRKRSNISYITSFYRVSGSMVWDLSTQLVVYLGPRPLHCVS